MELPQQRPLGAEGRKPTHDFLSLYIHSTVQPDPKPPSQGGGGEGHLKTHDFLQPLERLEKTAAKEETNLEVVSTPEKPPPAGEHILPGGIGSYSISHISYFNKKIPKPESGGAIFTVVQAASSADRKVDDNSNCSSYTAGSGFTFWEESAIKKGKTGKENLGERSNFVRETASGTGEWTTSERPSLSSRNNHRHSFSSLYSSHHPSSEPKSQSFMEMIKSAKDSSQDDDLDDDEEFFLKRESHSPINKGELKVNVDGKSSDQKPNTPRSKHSATEQRRRSKINDRFQKLREIIPHSDQKRDKASFLLEVIEYIQFLQVKVRKYEGSDHGWNNDPPKFVPWKISNGPAERYVDQSRSMNGDAVPPLLFATKLDDKNIGMSPAVGSTQKLVESDMKCSAVFKSIDQPSGITNKAIPFPLSLQPNVFDSGRTGGPLMASDGENTTTQPQSQSCHTRSCTNDGDAACDKLKEQELAIEGGTISISNVYSQGLLNNLTQALQNSGVDLSHANISVQIELGKREDGRQVAPTPTLKDNRVPSSNQGTTRPRVSNGSESDQAPKKLKMGKS